MVKKETKLTHIDQHIIPKSYLKAWNDDTLINKDSGKAYNQPQVWAYNKITGKEEQLSAKTNFTHEDFYTIEGEEGERDLTIEHALDKVEVKFDWIRDNKLLKHEQLDPEEHFQICLFIATMHNRTISRINHLGDMLKPIQEKLKGYEEFTKTATVEELKKMSGISRKSDSEAINIEELNEVIAKPLENIMVPIVNHLAVELTKLKMAIFYTKEDFGFITSDNPCVWKSQEAQMRHPMFSSPGLNDDTINIILPISPTHCILLNKQIEGYIDIDTNPESIDQINTLIYEHAENCIISNQKGIKFT
ncbi:DUF4238 domain-containing protein [Aliarcobacter butzleri]|uniref:DUF4238 domain-containing protein n=1 Tax=Aliarcobacter butzleri TaxID=28197 RepID=UPI0021B4057C|nr:DUF4238 domain-containing protein [Aliarcobacter butzleri]MCT7557572.1 DUF4238 domain-containing protein [Aliarcobacter butzleri]